MKKIFVNIFEKNRKWIYPVALVLIITIGATLQLYDLGGKSLWVDEIASVRDSESITTALDGAQPPLYYLILHFFRYVGTNETILRFPSVVFGILTIIMMYMVGKLFGGAKIGLISAFLLSISPFHVYYSQEARMYTLLGFLTLCSVFFFYKSISENRKIFVIAFFISTILTLYTHFFGVFVILFEIAFVFLLFIRNKFLSRNVHMPTKLIKFRKITLLIFVLVLIFILVLFLPFFVSRFGIPSFSAESQPQDTGTNPDIAPSQSLEISFLVKLFGEFSNGSPFGYDNITLFLFMFIFICGFIFYLKKDKATFILLLLWIILPVVLLFWASTLPFVTRNTPVYAEPRYLIFVLPAYLLCISKGISGIAKTVIAMGVSIFRRRSSSIWKKSRNVYIIVFIILIISITSITPFSVYFREKKQDWRSVAQYLENEMTANDIVVIEPNYFYQSFSYYFKNQKNTSITFAYGNLLELERIHNRNNNLWLIISPSQDNTEITNWANQNSLWMKKYGGNLHLYFILNSSSIRYKAAVFTNIALTKNYISWWNTLLASIGISTTLFDDAADFSKVELLEYDLVLFIDIKRPPTGVELLYLRESIRNGTTVILNGVSPYWIAGGTSDLASINAWFGATVFSEAPYEERWSVKFTDSAKELTANVDTTVEYAFYTDSDWSTPTATIAEPESVVYAYRVDDGAATIFSHAFGNGIVVFNGIRFGFESDYSDVSQHFLQTLLQSLMDRLYD